MIKKISAVVAVLGAIIGWKVFFGKKKVKQKVLVENLGANVPSLNLHNLSDLPSMRVCSDIYECLLQYNQSGEIELTGA